VHTHTRAHTVDQNASLVDIDALRAFAGTTGGVGDRARVRTGDDAGTADATATAALVVLARCETGEAAATVTVAVAVVLARGESGVARAAGVGDALAPARTALRAAADVVIGDVAPVRPPRPAIADCDVRKGTGDDESEDDDDGGDRDSASSSNNALACAQTNE
jgi:hypothetical protein